MGLCRDSQFSLSGNIETGERYIAALRATIIQLYLIKCHYNLFSTAKWQKIS